MLIYDTAGDPITGLKWTKKTTQKISDELGKEFIQVSADTVGRILKDMNYSLKVNYKKIESDPKKVTPASKIKRNQQFDYIKQLREEFSKQDNPIISTDAKKRELVGNFKNQGAIWCKNAKQVNVYDFRSLAIGVCIPYGIYNVLTNNGFVVIGISYNTAEFAVCSIEKWWNIEGNRIYSTKNSILILADGGGSNGAKTRLWKLCIQQILCNRYNLNVTVCHYPPGTSKYNPIEHRLFPHVTRACQGVIFKSIDIVKELMQKTSTNTGLKVIVNIIDKVYQTGRKVNADFKQNMSIIFDDYLPNWNYQVVPRSLPNG